MSKEGFCWAVTLHYPKRFQQCSNTEKSVVLFKITGVFFCFLLIVFFSDIEYAKNNAKMAETAKSLASQQVTEKSFLYEYLLDLVFEIDLEVLSYALI